MLLNPVTSLAEQQERSGFWGAINIGGGQVEQTIANVTTDDTNLFLGFEFGYTINPYFLLGLELSGWNQESSNFYDYKKGEGI